MIRATSMEDRGFLIRFAEVKQILAERFTQETGLEVDRIEEYRERPEYYSDDVVVGFVIYPKRGNLVPVPGVNNVNTPEQSL